MNNHKKIILKGTTKCPAQHLPKQIWGSQTREMFESLRFVFGEDCGTMFVHCSLPIGWKIRDAKLATSIEIVDGCGRKRGSIWIRDDSAHMLLTPRYDIQTIPHVKSMDTVLHEVAFQDVNGYVVKSFGSVEVNYAVVEGYGSAFDITQKAEHDALFEAAETWAQENYPEYRDVQAYWD